ncbi:MAG: SulP family inorganic anion transporter [Verrucomicrobiota bacterium JB024]|nr:SulP family inorganic anion transporter [Verrucomicrobiota bacterium JB024]
MRKLRVKTLARWLVSQNQLDFFPLRKHLRGYTGSAFKGDFRAGLNVALLAFPQGMAYAMIAGLPIQYGIYGSAIAAIAATFFAGSRFITLGPTNATSVTLASAFAAMEIMPAEMRAQYMPLLLLLIGLLLIVGAYLKVANLIQYISRTVVVGYITAAALLIIVGQLKNVVGVKFAPGEEAITFFDKLFLTVKHLPESHPESVILSVLTLILYYALSRRLPKLPNVAIVLVVMSGLAVAADAFAASRGGGLSFQWLSSIDASQWKFTPPSLNFDAISQVGNMALAIALLCVLEGTSIGKSLAARSGERLDANQEMFSIGVANMTCGFFSGMPASGSLTRSQLSWDSGGSTPLASLFNGLIVAGGAFALGPFIRYVPQSVLAVLVITIGLSLINRRAIKLVSRATRGDAIVFFSTLIAGLLVPLDTAIYFGVGLSIILFLRKAASPELVEYGFTDEGQLTELEEQGGRRDPEISIIHVEGDLFFGAAEIFRDQMRRVCEDANLKIVIVKMRNARHLDATAVMAIEELLKFMNEHDRHLLFSECKKDVIRVFKNSGLLDELGRGHGVFPDTPHNPTKSTANALRRAMEIMGGQQADIKIYVNPGRKKG